MNLIIITGQTATGKTKLALDLAVKYNGELINFDSRQVYKYLDIITGKDLQKNSEFINKNSELKNKFNIGYYLVTIYNHLKPFTTNLWLYDVVTPDQYFSSFDFAKLARNVINEIVSRGKTPILVGGTYLYLKHLLYGINENNSPPNFDLRKKLNNKSVGELQNILKKLSLQSFNRLNHSDQLNPRRLIRKIEIASVSTSAVKNRQNKEQTAEVEKVWPISQFIGLRYKDKSKLRQVILKRVEDRLKNGAIEEVEKLLKMDYKATDPGMKTIGYQQVIKYLNKEFTYEKLIDDWVNNEVQYAKRQLTFMKKDKNIGWREI